MEAQSGDHGLISRKEADRQKDQGPGSVNVEGAMISHGASIQHTHREAHKAMGLERADRQGSCSLA